MIAQLQYGAPATPMIFELTDLECQAVAGGPAPAVGWAAVKLWAGRTAIAGAAVAGAALVERGVNEAVDYILGE